MIAYFNRFQIKMTMAEAKAAYHRGMCDDDVEALLRKPHIRNQLEKIKMEDIQAELKEYGAWDRGELQEFHNNRLRILWIAAGDIVEESKSSRS